MTDETHRIITVLGPTASGKTRLAVEIAGRFSGEIISADSRQLYRGMTIGTGKDLNEYQWLNTSIPYHLIDCADPEKPWDLFQFQRACYDAIREISSRGHVAVLTGGTGMYLSSILQHYQLIPAADEADFSSMSQGELVARLQSLRPLHNQTDILDRKRTIQALRIAISEQAPLPVLKINSFTVGTRWPRPVLYQRIGIRLRERIQAGMLAEIRQLLDSGVSGDQLRYFGLEYKWGADLLEGRVTQPDFETGLFQAIRQFAKRQETWFRKMERDGIVIHWIDEPMGLTGALASELQAWFARDGE